MEEIIDLFFENAKREPEKCAIWCDGKTATYGELADLVTCYANLFLENGIQYNEHIGFPMNNSIESVGVMLAAAEIGCALVPINPTLPQQAVERAFSSGNVRHLVARANFLKKYEEWGLEVPGAKLCVDGEHPGAAALPTGDVPKGKRPGIPRTGQELFIITMTSGSTGNPKPIALTQHNKLLRARKHIQLYGLTRQDRILAATPLYHSLAERLVLMPLMLGATSILLPRFTPELWMKCVEEQKVTFTIAVSAQLAQVSEKLSGQEASANGWSSLRCLVSSSALLEPRDRARLLEQLSCDFHEMYGTSETSTATDIHFKESAGKQNSVGRPLPGVELVIRKEDGSRGGPGEVGEITCKTDLMCDGYYGKQELFLEACDGEYFRTGDLGYMDEDGYLYYTARKKEIIITGGINVYPADIEGCIRQLKGVKECAAFSYPDERLGEVVAVAVVGTGPDEINKRTVQVQCAKYLADYQQPHRIYMVDELPRNSMGKLVRGKLLEQVE